MRFTHDHDAAPPTTMRYGLRVTKPQEPWFGETGGAATLGSQIEKVGAWGDEKHPLFREYVAREHLEGGLPISYLHRNHGLSLTAVRRWIATYARGGREAMTRETAAENAKAKARADKLAAKGAGRRG